MTTWHHWFQKLLLIHLTLHKSEHSVPNTHYCKMLVFFIIVGLGPFENTLNSFSVGIVYPRYKVLRGSRNINTIQLLQLSFERLIIHVEVDGNYASSSTLQEFDMRCFDELFSWEGINDIIGKQCLILSIFKYFILNSEKFFIPRSLSLYWLCEYTNNWVLNFLSNMMSCTNHGRVVHSIMHALRVIKMNVAIYTITIMIRLY